MLMREVFAGVRGPPNGIPYTPLCGDRSEGKIGSSSFKGKIGRAQGGPMGPLGAQGGKMTFLGSGFLFRVRFFIRVLKIPENPGKIIGEAQ